MMEEVQHGQAGEDHEPEPEEHVDLLVDDVDRQDTLDIVSLGVERS